MGKEHYYFGAGGETNLHFPAVVILLVAAILLWILPRRYALIPLLVAAIFIPLEQHVVVGGLHFTLYRILLLFGFVRLGWLRMQEGRPLARWTLLDGAVVAYAVASTITYYILWGEPAAFVNRLGFLYSMLGLYFLTRYMVRDEKDIDHVARALAVVMIVLAVFMVNEQVTGRNVFSIFGGVPAITELRGAHLRSQGPFAHPITAGTFGATLFPLLFGQWWQMRRKRTLLLAGATAAVVVSFCSMSSTPVLTLAAGMFALLLWNVRKQMKWIRGVTVAGLVGLHLVMKAPVWALIARIGVTESSSSYHRYQLVDQTIRHFSEWWLVGTRGTFDWGWDMWDTANHYVEIATQGGLITLLLFLTVLFLCFRGIGIAGRASAGSFEHTRRLWVLGSMLFAHSVAFFGISYFDQSVVPWYMGLSLIATAVTLRPSAAVASAAEAAEPSQESPPELDWADSFGDSLVADR